MTTLLPVLRVEFFSDFVQLFLSDPNCEIATLRCMIGKSAFNAEFLAVANTLVLSRTFVILSVCRRAYCFWRFESAKFNCKQVTKFEINCNITTRMIKRLSTTLKCSTLQNWSNTVFKGLRFRPTTRQRKHGFQLLPFSKFSTLKPIFESLRFRCKWRRFFF